MNEWLYTQHHHLQGETLRPRTQEEIIIFMDLIHQAKWQISVYTLPLVCFFAELEPWWFPSEQHSNEAHRL